MPFQPTILIHNHLKIEEQTIQFEEKNHDYTHLIASYDTIKCVALRNHI